MKLRNLLITLPLLILPTKQIYSQDTITINPHFKPNLNGKNYGSGNVSNPEDSALDWDDFFELENLIQTENYPNNKIKDNADINIDGKVDYKDLNILIKKLNEEVPYLPNEWNNANPEDRKALFLKFQEIYEKNPFENPNHPFGWNCRSNAIQNIIEMNGTNSQNILDYYNLENKGRFNIPEGLVYLANDSSKFYHGVVASLFGNKTSEFKNWIFYDPTTAKRYFPEKDPRMQGGELCIRQIPILPEDQIQDELDLASIASFKIENGKGIHIGVKNPWGLYERPAKIIETRDTTNISQNPIYTTTNGTKTNSENQINVYPNPFDNFTTFEFGKNNLENKLIISDISGNEILSKTIYDNKFNYSFSNLASGMYIAKIIQNNEIISRKLIKK